MHLYLKDKSNGKFIGHLKIDDTIWSQYEAVASDMGITMEELINRAITEAIKHDRIEKGEAESSPTVR